MRGEGEGGEEGVRRGEGTREKGGTDNGRKGGEDEWSSTQCKSNAQHCLHTKYVECVS